MRWTLCVGLLLAFTVMARAAEEPQVSVTAIGTVKAPATDLTVSVALTDKGEDAAAAIANIGALREKVTSKLAEYGGKLDADMQLPAIVEANPNQQRQRYRAVGRLKKAADPSKPVKTEVTMRQNFVAHIPLKGKDGSAVLLEAEALKAKLRPEVTKIVKTEAPPEEAEDPEEMQNFGENSGNASPVNFWYSAKRSESLEDKAVAEALTKAKEGASRTAKAMGGKTTVVHSVAVHASSSRGGRQWDENYGQWREASMGDTSDPVLYSDTPTVSLSSTLTVVFRLQ